MAAIATLGLTVHAQAGDGQKTLTAEKTTIAPKVDGVLDDPVWELAEPGGDFIQTEPDEGKSATQPTTFRVAFDKANLYIAARMTDDHPDRIANNLTRRDRDSESDWFGLIIDSYHDHKTARFFLVNAAGVQRDGSVSNDNNMDDSWDGVWESAVRIGTDGWVAEMRIPFSALRFASGDSATWGLNTLRYLSRNKEQAWWCPVSRSDSRLVSTSGHLTGIDTADAPRRFAATPYGATTGALNTEGEGTASISADDADISGRVGIDMQYGITTDLALDLTVNPDFGQVEVDQAVLNLTAFETLFPEKRPFFLEGADIFNLVGTMGDGGAQGTRMFYSRRIGGQPRHYYDYAGAPDDNLDGVPDFETLENPAFTPILGAAKVTGRNHHGLSTGFLEAVTGETHATVRNADGSISEPVTSPYTNYAVARLKQEIGQSSYVGGMVTAVNRQDQLEQPEPDAYTAAADAILRTDDGRYSVAALLGGTTRFEDNEFSNGTIGRVIVSKEAGEKVVAAASYSFVTPDFEVNDLGYNQRADEHGGWIWVQLRKLDGWGPFRSLRFNQNAWGGALMEEGKVANLGANVNVNMNFRNYWFSYVGVGVDAAAYDAYESRIDGLLYHRPASGFVFGGIESDGRKPVQLGLGFSGATDELGGKSVTLEPSVTARIGTRTELSLGSTLGGTRTETAFATVGSDPATGEDISVFGRRDVDQVNVWARGTLTFTEKLSLQFFSQLLVAEGLYGDFMRLGGDGGLSELGAAYSDVSDGTPDFNERYFNANVILRWEYLPGSAFYAVWTQSRSVSSSDAGSSLVSNVGSAFNHGSDNALMLKLSYRWGT